MAVSLSEYCPANDLAPGQQRHGRSACRIATTCLAPQAPKEKSFANQDRPQNNLAIGHQETPMTELEVIAKDIIGLKQLLRVAWEDLGSTHLGSSERREIRSQMRQAALDLHHALQDFQDEHDRLRKLHAEKCEKERPRRVKLRLVD
jgi:hypothetical protein